MLKLSESFVDDVIRRGITGEDREEDKFNPDYFDLGYGTSVYWTSHNFDRYGDTVTYNKVKDINLNGWRLPTKEEVEELEPCWSNACISRGKGTRIIRLHKNEEYYELEINAAHNYNSLFMWMNSQNNDKNCYGYDYLDFRNATHLPPDYELYVLLVKDKK